MLKFRYVIMAAIISLTANIACGEYEYMLIEKDQHKIHVLTLDPNEYDLSMVSSHNSVFGRERVGDIAKRENAQIAFNSGFFEIGDNQDGRPTGTLVIDGKIVGLRTTEHACLIKKANNYDVKLITPSLKIKSGKEVIDVQKFNKFALGKNIFYFNSYWGKKTLSSYNDRKEIVIGQDNKILEVSNHGNNEIPDYGSVISFPASYDINEFKQGQKIEFIWTPEYLLKKGTFAVMGIPALVLDGVIKDKLSNEEKHARTAIGIKDDGKLLVVVVEHYYRSDMSTLNIQDIKKIMDKKNMSMATTTVSDVKKLLVNDTPRENMPVGLTTLELANLMKELGAKQAINLDGGGSSSLYVAGKYVNQSFGDKDEGNGQKTIRPVSDAIIIKKK